MKSYKFASLWVLVFFAGFLVIVGFKSGGARVRTQNKSQQAPSREATAGSAEADVIRLSAPAKMAPRVSKAAEPAPYEAAARENEQLQASLSWSFGGKVQRGWGIYTPLIADLIDTEPEASQNQFAGQLSLWQKQNGLQADGVLETNSWSQMVSTFQSGRIARPYLAPTQLVTIPASDCYDPSRPEELRKAEPETYAAYKRMVAAAAADRALGLQLSRDGELAANERFLKIVSAYRSREYQDQLRKQSPNSGRAGLAINSPHSTGRALDLYVGGEPVSTKDDNRALQTRGAVYHWLVKNAARFGFRPYFYEPWHWEYVGIRNGGGPRRQGDGAN